MQEQVLNSEILSLFNEKLSISSILEQVSAKLKKYLGCEALGIRLKDSQGNIPYAVTTGFNDSFLAKENALCVRSDSCACIDAIRGDYNPDLPFYTEKGSFFTTELQSLTPVIEGMRTGAFRGECVRRGWECLGLVPIRFAHKYFGAIHFVDSDADIEKKQVHFVENIAAELGLYFQTLEAGKEKEDEFLAVVQQIIHDLKSPLTSIQGFSELISLKYAGQFKNDLQDMVSRIGRNSEYIEHLVKGLGEFAQAAGGKEEQSENIDLNKFIKDLVSDIDLPRKGEVEIKVNDNLPEIFYPPFSLKRILSNLMGNAVKYTPPDRKPVVEIALQEKDIFFKISVKDSGAGINADEVEKVFYPLYRSSDVADIRGSGLGLSICKKIVEKNGGTIWVYSEKGKGSTFYFTVPK